MLALAVAISGVASASAVEMAGGLAPSAAPEPGLVLAQASGSEEGPEGEVEARSGGGSLEPRYQPREPEKEPWYNSSYIFGMTRGLANSTIAPAGKAPLFIFTIPLDIVTLPFTLIGGLFG